MLEGTVWVWKKLVGVKLCWLKDVAVRTFTDWIRHCNILIWCIAMLSQLFILWHCWFYIALYLYRWLLCQLQLPLSKYDFANNKICEISTYLKQRCFEMIEFCNLKAVIITLTACYQFLLVSNPPWYRKKKEKEKSFSVPKLKSSWIYDLIQYTNYSANFTYCSNMHALLVYFKNDLFFIKKKKMKRGNWSTIPAIYYVINNIICILSLILVPTILLTCMITKSV